MSGFLITSLIIREWTITANVCLKSFYFRRVRRLGPALIAVLVAACLYETLYLPYPGVENIFIRSFYALDYFANWVWAFQASESPLGSLDALWSLSIEEQFYMTWPAILIFLLRRRISLERPFLRKKLGFAELERTTQQLWLLADKSARGAK